MDKILILSLVITLAAVVACNSTGQAQDTPTTGESPATSATDEAAPPAVTPDDIVRVDATSAVEAVQSGEGLLVCAYQDAQACADLNVEGAISLSELQQIPELNRDQRLIFFCS